MKVVFKWLRELFGGGVATPLPDVNPPNPVGAMGDDCYRTVILQETWKAGTMVVGNVDDNGDLRIKPYQKPEYVIPRAEVLRRASRTKE